MSAAFSPEFLVTSFVVVVIPGTGVIYTISNGLGRHRLAGWWAAIGCTLGIVPHLLATVLGLAAIMHQSALLYQSLRYLGAGYIAYVAWQMWSSAGTIVSVADERGDNQRGGAIVVRGIILNLLNPRLTLFFIAFLPQFVPPGTDNTLPLLVSLSGTFMLMTLVVFLIYATLAHQFRAFIVRSRKTVRNAERALAGTLALLALRLGLPEGSE